MTTNPMNCELFTEQLMAFLEHETDDATRSAMERHAVTCAECGALVADLRKLRIDAANLPEMQPSRDLWSGIAARIEAPVVSIGTRQAEPTVGTAVAGKLRRWLRGASIAAGLVFAAGVGYFARGSAPAALDVPAGTPVAETPFDTTLQVAVTPETSTTVPATITPVAGNRDAVPVATNASRPMEVQVAERAALAMAADYDREIARLRVLIDQRRNQLDPVTVAVIERSLLVIDTAIAESKKAIARDPASGFLMESLNQSLRSKVELMRTAAVLPSRSS